MTNFNIKDSLSVSHQGAVIAAMGALSDFNNFFTEPAKHLSNVVSRLGLGAAVASMAFVALSAIPTQAQAQNTVQQINQMNFITAATGLAADMKGLDRRSVELARLAALGAGAATNGPNAPLAGALAGLGAILIQNKSPQISLNETPGSRGGVFSNNSYQQGSSNYQQSGNPQNQAVQYAYASYQRIAEPQYRIAVQAHMEGNVVARQSAIVTFANVWKSATELGLPLNTIPDDVAKFEHVQRMDPNALQAGLGGARTTYQQPGTSMR